MTDPEGPPVRVGQVWADNDKRAVERRLRVLYLEVRDGSGRLVTDPDKQARPTHACCVVEAGVPRAIGRTSLIRLDRFRPTASGYRLIADAPE